MNHWCQSTSFLSDNMTSNVFTAFQWFCYSRFCNQQFDILLLFSTEMSSSGSENEESTPPLQISRQARLALASKIKIIPEGGWGWVICTAAFVAQLIVMGIHNSFGILYTTLLEEYKKSKAETGMLRFFLKNVNFQATARQVYFHQFGQLLRLGELHGWGIFCGTVNLLHHKGYLTFC